MDQPRLTEAFGNEIYAHMGRRRLKQKDLAKLTGISAATLSRKFKGDYPFDLDDVEKMCKALELAPEQVLADSRSRCCSPVADFFRLGDGTKALDESLAA